MTRRTGDTSAHDSSTDERNSIGEPRSRLPCESTIPGANPGLSWTPPGSGSSSTSPLNRYPPPLLPASAPTTGRKGPHCHGERTSTWIPTSRGCPARRPYCPLETPTDVSSASAGLAASSTTARSVVAARFESLGSLRHRSKWDGRFMAAHGLDASDHEADAPAVTDFDCCSLRPYSFASAQRWQVAWHRSTSLPALVYTP